MLRQSGALAQRLFCNGALQTQNNSSKLIWNAAFLNTKASSSILGDAQTPGGDIGAQMAVPQFSSATAAALASKQQHLTGLNGWSLKPGRAFGSFSSAAAGPSAAAASAASQAAEKPKEGLLRKLAKAAAVIAGAVALACSPVAADTPTPWQWGFQDSATSHAQAVVDLHHDIMFFIITIVTLVGYLIFQFATKFHYSKQLLPEKLTHHATMEVIWTIIPTLIVLSIAIPSLTLIYAMDQHQDRPGLTVKVIGRQWYWSYEMHDHLQHKLVDPDRLVSIAEKAIKA